MTSIRTNSAAQTNDDEGMEQVEANGRNQEVSDRHSILLDLTGL